MSTPAPVHVYQTYIRASAEQVWQAITDPEFTKRYWHRTAFESAFEPGSPYRMVLPDGSDAVVGTIEEVEPNRRLVMTWRILYDAAAVDEPPSRIEWLLTEGDEGVTKVTTIHRDLALSPVTEASVRDGWFWVLQSMKSLLETGEALPGSEPGCRRRPHAGSGVGRGGRGRAAPAPRHHGEQLDVGTARRPGAVSRRGRRRPRPRVRGDCITGGGRHAAVRRTPPAVRGSCPASTPCSVTATSPCTTPSSACEVVEAAGLDDFDLAYAHEARARALACLGRLDEAAVELKAAHAVPIADPEDKSILDADLAAEPWYGSPPDDRWCF